MSEYKPKDGMIDNRMVHDDHQQGIKRVLQRGYNPLDCNGHFGKMGVGGKQHSHFSRQGYPLTPRKA